jgi:Ala-tRNA(Pro) deacylase
MSAIKLKDYLDEQNIKYISIIHSQAYTAQETAQSAHIPGREMAKTVIVKINDKMAMVVLPASEKVDLDLVKGATHAESVQLADEREFEKLFSNCEIGAMPPFGNLYGMPVYVEESLGENENIAFNAGSHTELIKLSFKDFERLVHPKRLRASTIYTS